MTILVFIGSLIGAMALGMPIAYALLSCGIALMYHLGATDAQILAQKLIDGTDNYPLMAVPFFLLAGEFMNVGGLSKRIVNVAMALLGHIRGGLGYVVIASAMLLASLSGSAIADTAALSVLLLPLMRQGGYDLKRSVGLIATAGIIAPVIPPSIGLVVFGVTAGVSITKLFFAGIAPGFMMAAALVATWWWLARREAFELPEKKSMAEIVRAIVDAIWAFFLPVIIFVGLKMGVFTPTEAGVIAAVYALVVSLCVYREISVGQVFEAFLAAAKTSAVIMIIVAASLVTAWLITIANIPDQIIDILEPFMGNKFALMCMVMILVFAVGTALDFTPTILILTPVLMPVLKNAGIDPVYFGILFIMNNAIGLITPPVGTVLNVVCGIGRVNMDDAIKGVMPFMLVELLVMFLLVAFPSLVTVPASFFR
ncbi:TRAP transporter large permease subunit [Propionivibrio sp.]|uniref:TRAP transporter large permease subunit n=1 Tax=Propionivibrio sp. TaxID=2212460 RepID=UPI0039E25B3D